jgi:hypothetical protein
MSTAIMLALTAALGATPVSQSKLGVFVSNDDPNSILAACPRFAVFPLPSTNPSIATVMSTYKAGCDGARIIAQVGGRNLPVLANTQPDPAWVTGVQNVNAACSSCIEGVEGPSEPQGNATDVAAFWARFAQAVSSAGFLPIVGGLAPGLPLGGGSSADAFCVTATAVRTQVPLFAWSYHARSSTMSTDPTIEAATTFAYRQIAADCASAGVSLTSNQLFLTEAGPSSRAWLAADAAWLVFLDAQISQDATVQGAALFQASTDTFSLGPAVATALKMQLANPTTTDGGTDGGADSGVGSASQGGPPIGGELNPSNPNSGCSTGGPAFLMLALSPVLFFIRRTVARRTRARTP